MNDNETSHLMADLHSASFAWAMSCCRGNREIAEEVLQTAYVRALKSRKSFQGRSKFRSWLFAIIRNTAIDLQRGPWWRRLFQNETVPEISVAESNEDSEDEIARIRQTMGNLPGRQREVVHLVFYEDLTLREAADVMGISIGSARQHYARAKQTLKLTLKSIFEEENEPTKK